MREPSRPRRPRCVSSWTASPWPSASMRDGMSIQETLTGPRRWAYAWTAMPCNRVKTNAENGEAAPFREAARSEEHTSELQSLMRISYAVFCLKKKKHNKQSHTRSYANPKEQSLGQHRLT